MSDFQFSKKIILFDGVCNLCQASVLKIIKHDKHNNFLFASLQSPVGQKIRTHIKASADDLDSVILFNTDTSYSFKSTAALKIMYTFGGFWKLTAVFWLIPRVIRDLFYDYIAAHRYQWFGKKDQCMIPKPELTSKFLNS